LWGFDRSSSASWPRKAEKAICSCSDKREGKAMYVVCVVVADVVEVDRRILEVLVIDDSK
jgi:hypothetical protein